ncbi:MAG: hypothetical protein KAS66_12885 [Candidatus Omnitrophica bacterium]|nr:hypothetical protein [Candidatus Omnitrophota bacterium]
MQRKHLGYIMAGCISLIFILVLNLNVMAQGGSQIPFSTDKSDRTILKEVLVNQGKTHALLKEIKVLLQEAK